MVSLQTSAPQASGAPQAAAGPPFPGRIAPAARARSFYTGLAGALIYPFRGPGLWLIAGWIVLSAIQAYISHFRFMALAFLFVRMIVGVMVVGYLCAYMLKLVVSSAAGEKVPPDWPDFGNFWDDILRPMFLVVGTCAVAFLPVTVYWLANVAYTDLGLEFTGEVMLLRVLAVLGALYLPMALLAVAMYDSFTGLNPLRVFGSVAKVFIPYVVTCVVMILVVLGVSLFGYLPQIPIVSFVLSSAISIYLVMVEMRLIGLLYYSHRFRLNWFDEVTDRHAVA